MNSAFNNSLGRPFRHLIGRRDLLRVGSLGIAASALPGSACASQPAKAQSVLFLFMAGGVTHLDSFDPKPEAPEEVRGKLETIDTRLPGVHFTEVMPGLAKAADKFALL